MIKKNYIPRVSIGMPVYNGGRFVREAIDSILTQTFTDFELIISDNASADETEAICRAYVEKDSRVRYIRHIESIGPLANFQFVLDEAIGEYFMWAAHDDSRNKCFVEMAIKVMDDDKSCGLVFSEFNTCDLLTGETVRISVDMFKKGTFLKNYFMRLIFTCSSIIYGLHRTGILRQVPLKLFDYFDVYLVHWYSIYSNIKIIPISLYTAGTVGKRIPYSVTGPHIDATHFYKAEWKLLRENTSLIKAVICYVIMRCLYSLAVRKLNNKILKEIAK